MDAVAPLVAAPGPRPDCPVCGARDLVPLLNLDRVPVHCNLLWPTREAALAAPRGELRLARCRRCGHAVNRAFDPQRMAYGGSYDNSLHFSPHFRRYARELAEDLVGRFALRRQRVLEIGCGRGDFLRLLVRLGENTGTGFDPSWQPDGVEEAADIRFVPAPFAQEQAAGLDPDFVCCRQVLEHLPDPRPFLEELSRSLKGRPVPVFFEVPNAEHTFGGAGLWDLIYEHPQFFTRSSLAELFRRGGFRPLAVRAAFAGQYLQIEAVAAAPPEERVDRPALPDLPGLAAALAARTAAWRQRLREAARRGERTVVWGAGSKGVTFLTLVGAEGIAAAVDLNPRKQRKYLPGTGLPVVAPESLADRPPERVLVMNPAYREEIGRELRRLEVRSAIETV